MQDIGNDLGKQFEEFAQRTHGVLKRLPLIAANTGKNFFQARFNTQDWLANTRQPWRKRKDTAKRDKGRAILTDTGRLKRSIRVVRADWTDVIVGSNDVPYAAANNDGFKGTVNISQHARIASRKVGTKELKLKGKQRNIRLGGRKQKIRGASHVVKSYTRKVDLPKRQFIGNSQTLNRFIQRDFINELNKL